MRKCNPFYWCMLESFPFIERTFQEIDAYKLLCRIVEYLDKTVDKTNVLGKKVEELNNWINTLDLQDEVNKKLDEMAESGELQEIIAQYVNIQSILVYKTVAEMKQADNLIVGSIVKTLGFYNLNDSGNAYYIVREVINTDNINEKNIIALKDENLVAEFIVVNDTINPAQLGAKFDDETDDTESWELAINYANNLKLRELVGLRKLSKITRTLKIPVNLKINTLWISTDNVENLTNNYMVFFNSNDGGSWIVPYNNATYSIFENIRLVNKTNSLVNGMLLGGNVTIINIKSDGLDIVTKTLTSYIDVVNMKNIDIGGKRGTNYCLDLGFLGDAVSIDTIHIHDTNYDAGGVNNLIKTGTGKNPSLIKNVINGVVSLEGGMIELNGMHGESNSKIIATNGTFKISNTYFWAGNEPSLDFNNAKVTLENFINRYNYSKSYTNDVDIKLSGTTTINFSNCYKDILHQNDINKHFRTKIKTSLGNYVQEPFLGMRGNITNNARANAFKTNAGINPSTNDYYINSPVNSDEGTWQIESSTYYYMAHALLDNVRMLGYGFDHKQSSARTKDGSALKFGSVPAYTPIRIYRGLADNTYNKYIDIVNFDSSIVDNGNICAGLLWQDRDAGGKDAYLYATQVEWIGDKVIVWAGGIPSAGTWKTGDIIIDTSPSAGSPKGWICSAGGTPGTWISLGNL